MRLSGERGCLSAGQRERLEEAAPDPLGAPRGTVVYISPGARLTMDRWSGFMSVGIPVVNDLNGVESEPDRRLVSGVTVGF